MWYEERIQKKYKARYPRFSMCCKQGRIILPLYRRPPQPLYDLFNKQDQRGKFFLANIRSFNSMFAFTSMGGKIDTKINDGGGPPIFVLNGENYHQIGSLLPLPDKEPKFAQLYIYDTENEVANRMAVVRYFSPFCFIYHCFNFLFLKVLNLLISIIIFFLIGWMMTTST